MTEPLNNGDQQPRQRPPVPRPVGNAAFLEVSSQFTSTDFTKVLKTTETAISIDGKGAWRDNVFVGRLWRTVQYEGVYLRAYTGVTAARASIGRYLSFYNEKRSAFVAWRANARSGIHQPGDAHPGGSLKRAADPLKNTPEGVQTNGATSLDWLDH
jgi:hypothetical protein